MEYSKPRVVVINLKETADVTAYARCSGADRSYGCS